VLLFSFPHPYLNRGKLIHEQETNTWSELPNQRIDNTKNLETTDRRFIIDTRRYLTQTHILYAQHTSMNENETKTKKMRYEHACMHERVCLKKKYNTGLSLIKLIRVIIKYYYCMGSQRTALRVTDLPGVSSAEVAVYETNFMSRVAY
jgi:hypothetical protein